MDVKPENGWAVVRLQKGRRPRKVAWHTDYQEAWEQMRRLNAAVPFPLDEPGYYTLRALGSRVDEDIEEER